MLKQLQLQNFRAFRQFTVTFGDGAYLVGPNNAGKSTILTALRTIDALLRDAYRRLPDFGRVDGERNVQALPVSLEEFPALQESLRHEFHSDETRLRLTWKSEARLTVVWPREEEETERGYFYLEHRPGLQPRTLQQVRTVFGELGVVPILVPVDHEEPLLTDRYVQRHVSGRLSSRHFRNELRLLRQSGSLPEFLSFATPWLNDIRLEDLDQHLTDRGAVLDLYFTERGSRIPKEIIWAGDGIQIWLQLLYHVWRIRHLDTIILDEPEVYLHPDLQRRLVQLLASTNKQIILATHSAEIVSEAPSSQVCLIDRARRRAVRAKDEGVLQQLSSALGSQFNLRLARALRCDAALFVEGDDMAVLRRACTTLGFARLASEDRVQVIPLHGFSRWHHVEPFSWLTREFLGDSVRVFVILDRDYRSDAQSHQIQTDFKAAGIDAHVWQRKELESYLINPAVISRVSGAAKADVEAWIEAAASELEDAVFSRSLDEELRSKTGAKAHAVSVTQKMKRLFDTAWRDPEFRRDMSPPKEILHAVNAQLQSAGKKTVSPRSLAAAHAAHEFPIEFVNALGHVEHSLGQD